MCIFKVVQGIAITPFLFSLSLAKREEKKLIIAVR
jgi:hypothetical protein